MIYWWIFHILGLAAIPIFVTSFWLSNRPAMRNRVIALGLLIIADIAAIVIANWPEVGTTTVMVVVTLGLIENPIELHNHPNPPPEIRGGKHSE
jgi:hypothetical protein